MPAAVLLRGGGRTFLIAPDSQAVEELPSWAGTSGVPPPLRASDASIVRSFLARLGPDAGLRAAEPDLIVGLRSAGLAATPAGLVELRRARSMVPAAPFLSIRSGWLADARRRLEAALASPEESLIALAREEERVERAELRETGASEQWVSGETGPLAEYARAWAGFREALGAHHLRLETELETAARRCVPNLASLLGGRVAGRLVAAAGGVAPLARMSASRLQLLGTRRRPGGDRGPKYGILARAVHAIDVPAGRHGALARSLAALASIAVRSDASTQADLSRLLLARRDRRVERLRRAGAR